MKRVLITGGSGFIGRHSLAPLIERGYEVHSLGYKLNTNLADKVFFHQLDLLNSHAHRQLIKQIKPSHLFHAAWYTENGLFWEATENVSWLKASISLLEAFYEAGGVRALGLGTCAEYDWVDGVCVEGKTCETPVSLYGKAKKALYECFGTLAQNYGKSFAWARIFFPFGPGESPKRLLPQVVTKLLQNQEAHCTHGNQLRDFLYVADLAKALAAVLDSSVSGAINIASGIPLTIREIVNRTAFLLDRTELVRFGAIPEPSYSPQKILADITRLKKEVGWSAAMSLDESLLNTIAWWRGQNKNMRRMPRTRTTKAINKG